MNRDKLDAMLMKMEWDSDCAEAVAGEALEWIRELLEQVETLEAGNAALRAEIKAAEDGFTAAAEQSRILAGELDAVKGRVVPAVEWDTHGVARVGLFTLMVTGADWWIAVGIDRSVVVIRYGNGGKDGCEAAFLRLVGCKND